MIITEFDLPLTAEDARKIALHNRDDSIDRSRFRELMAYIRQCASVGYTRYVSFPQTRSLVASEHVQNALRSMGYKVTEKRAYKWDKEANDWSDRPQLDHSGRETFFLEITWG